jgi:hypothetical protein
MVDATPLTARGNTMSKYTDIIERLTNADGPSMPINCEIIEALAPDAIIDSYPTAANYACVFHAEHLGIENKGELPNFTGSLDASIALCERLLPGWGWSVSRSDVADVTPPDRTDWFAVDTYEREPQIALLIATFRALEAQETETA